VSGGTFDRYIEEYAGKSAAVAAGAPFRSAFLALPGAIFLLFLARKWREQSIKDYLLVRLFSYLMAAMFPISFLSSVIGDRFGYYLYPIQLVILARLPLLVTGRYSTTAAFAPYAAEALLLVTWVEFPRYIRDATNPTACGGSKKSVGRRAVMTKQLRSRVALTKRLEARGAIQSGPFSGCGLSIRIFRSANAAVISIITTLIGGDTHDLKGGGAFMNKTHAT